MRPEKIESSIVNSSSTSCVATTKAAVTYFLVVPKMKATAASGPMQLFSECGFLKKSTASGIMEPDIDSMMKHIIKCLWALLTHERTNIAFRESAKFDIYEVAVRKVTSLSTYGLVSIVDQ
jgi:hypothetical protein